MQKPGDGWVFAALHNLGDEMGATYDLYWQGIDIPFGFRSAAAPSKHSGDSSLSPQDPVQQKNSYKNNLLQITNDV